MATEIMHPVTWRKEATTVIRSALSGIVPAKELQLALGACVAAFLAARNAARDPSQFDEVLRTEEGRTSLFQAATAAAMCGIYPGGPNPLAWLTPQRDRAGAPVKLRYSLSHRGVSVLAMDEGLMIHSVPVHVEDSCLVEFGEVVEHTPCDKEPLTLADLAGVYVTVKRGGEVYGRFWVSSGAILTRAKRSQTWGRDFGPWKTDPVPMSQKTAIHYLAARGSLPLRTTKVREALEDEAPAQPAPTVIEIQAPAQAATQAPAPAQIEERFDPEEQPDPEREAIREQARKEEQEAKEQPLFAGNGNSKPRKAPAL